MFFVRVSEGWGASANELALSPAEASVEAWRVRALARALEPDSDADEREELLFVSKVESDAGDASDADRLELAELPPWRGGPPGRARELAPWSSRSSGCWPTWTGCSRRWWPRGMNAWPSSIAPTAAY